MIITWAICRHPIETANQSLELKTQLYPAPGRSPRYNLVSKTQHFAQQDKEQVSSTKSSVFCLLSKVSILNTYTPYFNNPSGTPPHFS